MLSIPHLIIICLIAFIVLGPDKLPQVARALGKTMAEVRRMTSDFRSQIETEMRDADREREQRLQQAAIESAQAPPPIGQAPTVTTPEPPAAEPFPPVEATPEASPVSAEATPEPSSQPAQEAAPEAPAEPPPPVPVSVPASPENPHTGAGSTWSPRK
jgi:sec-independent protein translocase protein TatB